MNEQKYAALVATWSPEELARFRAECDATGAEPREVVTSEGVDLRALRKAFLLRMVPERFRKPCAMHVDYVMCGGLRGAWGRYHARLCVEECRQLKQQFALAEEKLRDVSDDVIATLPEMENTPGGFVQMALVAHAGIPVYMMGRNQDHQHAAQMALISKVPDYEGLRNYVAMDAILAKVHEPDSERPDSHYRSIWWKQRNEVNWKHATGRFEDKSVVETTDDPLTVSEYLAALEKLDDAEKMLSSLDEDVARIALSAYGGIDAIMSRARDAQAVLETYPEVTLDQLRKLVGTGWRRTVPVVKAISDKIGLEDVLTIATKFTNHRDDLDLKNLHAMLDGIDATDARSIACALGSCPSTDLADTVRVFVGHMGYKLKSSTTQFIDVKHRTYHVDADFDVEEMKPGDQCRSLPRKVRYRFFTRDGKCA